MPETWLLEINYNNNKKITFSDSDSVSFDTKLLSVFYCIDDTIHDFYLRYDLINVPSPAYTYDAFFKLEHYEKSFTILDHITLF
ncbi:hypothetical protein CTE07_11890 [Chitinophaga terrae (ex Kim and Jung 2007)]|nr:hypothetical protein CTE07_11890 [Chitinophaga terrae (ex Kim and Jung 2007)]